MSSWLIVWLIVGLFTSGLLAVGAIALVRQVMILGRAMRRVTDEFQPLADEIARGSARAGERTAGLRMPERSRRRKRRG